MGKSKKRERRRTLKLINFLIGALSVVLAFIIVQKLPHAAKFCANSESCIKDLSGRYEPNITGVFMGKRVTPPDYLAESQDLPVLGIKDPDKKHIFVNLTTQTLYAYDGDNLTYTFRVSTGKWYPTPIGDFRIWIKLRYTRMSGGNQSLGTDYNLPNVPFTMYYYNDQIPKSAGYALHGAYWHNNFGYPMSHGCTNMKIDEARKIFYWSTPEPTGAVAYATNENKGTLITVYGTTPPSVN